MDTLSRRSFLTSAGLAAAATTLAGVDLFSAVPVTSRRVAVFWETGFPTTEGMSISRDELARALQGLEVMYLSAEKLTSELDRAFFDLLLLPYGSAFPRYAWSAILRFLENGGNLLVLGGAPFHVPCVQENGIWRKEVESTAFHKILGITQAMRVDGIVKLRPASAQNSLNELSDGISPTSVLALTYRLTSTRDYVEEEGSGGQRDARVVPLVYGVNAQGRDVATAAVSVDRLLGRFSGGRWVLVPCEGTIRSESVRALAHAALQGPIEATVAPLFACYRPGEVPTIKVQLRRPAGSIREIVDDRVSVDVLNVDRKKLGSLSIQLSGSDTTISGETTMSASSSIRLEQGFHVLELQVKLRSLSGGSERTLSARSGFWMEDSILLASGPTLTSNGDFLLRDGNPFVVTGTTYMSSEVHRKFLLEPNPGAWRDDFAAMKKSGVNMVRTGIWTGWRNFMLDVGHMNETALRGLDAFIHTARSFDIPVIFTFFAFLPERWGGTNPFFDPRSVEAQKEFIGAIVRRYSSVKDVIWDFINEPSFSSPDRQWYTRPHYDVHERSAWTEWLKKTYPAPSDEARVSMLQERWRSTSSEALSLPTLEEFNDSIIFGDRRPLKALDYRLFAQEAFANWVREMTACVWANGGGGQMVTVGQDEGGTFERPGPHFFADVVDFTCLHNWWANDDLLWDSIVTKAPGKANLVEETGIMFLERPDSTPWRSADDARNLLERKLAISVGGSGAGFIQWIWNTNPYMDSENEAAIGFLRADGSEKPELDAFRNAAAFLQKNQHRFVEKQPERALLVLPHSHMFSVRNYATEATKRAVKVLHESCGIAVGSVSEYRLSHIKNFPAFIVLPSMQYFDSAAWVKLLEFVKGGSTLVVTGVIDRDAHWMPVDRSSIFGKHSHLRPVTSDESIIVDGQRCELTFRGEKIERIHKSVIEGETEARVQILDSSSNQSEGKVYWSPLPLELAVEAEPTAELYRSAMKRGGIAPDFTTRANPLRALIRATRFKECTLYMILNESDQHGVVSYIDGRSGASVDVNMKAQRSAFVILDAQRGAVIDQMVP